MTKPLLDISAQEACRLVLDLQGLAENPRRRLGRAGLLELIRKLGFVQVDSIQWVERAHHMILASRWDGYRQKDLTRLIETERALFENWTHDASILPVEVFPVWRHRFRREATRLSRRWADWHGNDYKDDLDHVLAHAADHGPITSRDMADERDPTGTAADGEWWNWKPSKTALEYHWRTGGLAICHRRGFQKAYDITERVIPDAHRGSGLSAADYVDWSCREALDRLGFGTAGEIAGYWGNVTASEAKDWCAAKLGKELVEVRVAGESGAPRKLFAPADIEARLAAARPPAARLRILNPFDPVIRDRKRLKHLFDFDYRIEIFVPAPQRTYGYYIFPLLEGERMIGRMDMKAERSENALVVAALWPEPGVQFGKGRMARLEAALERVRRLVGLAEVRFADGWLRPDTAADADA